MTLKALLSISLAGVMTGCAGQIERITAQNLTARERAAFLRTIEQMASEAAMNRDRYQEKMLPYSHTHVDRYYMAGGKKGSTWSMQWEPAFNEYDLVMGGNSKRAAAVVEKWAATGFLKERAVIWRAPNPWVTALIPPLAP